MDSWCPAPRMSRTTAWWMQFQSEPDQFNAINTDNGEFKAYDLKGQVSRTASFEPGFSFAGYYRPNQLFYLVNGQGEFREIDARTLQPRRAFTGAPASRNRLVSSKLPFLIASAKAPRSRSGLVS